MKSPEALADLARAVGWEAADILHRYYRAEEFGLTLDANEKADGPVTAADRAANHHILDRLMGELGDRDFGYLSEETYQQHLQQYGPVPIDRDWVWIIDPLDGTRDFIDQTGEYALHIALVHQGRPVVAVVACPEADKLYCAVRGSGTEIHHRDGRQEPGRVSDRADPTSLAVVVSRTHRDERFNQLLAALPCQHQTAVGSIGGKIAAIVDRRADVYLSLSGKSAPKDWDMAAPELILTEAGGRFSHFDGQPLRYNQGDISQWGGRIATNGPCHDLLADRAQALLDSLNA
ncbi:MAG: 3'(2'),5'-bisphosphate nucleotidase CysQ [Cyanophyceae cyanobacterium]